MSTRRRNVSACLLVIFALCIVFSLTGTIQAKEEKDKFGGTMRLAYGSELSRPNFLLTTDGAASMARDICCEKLYGVDGKGEFVSRIATSYDVSDDGHTYTVHIRKGVKWQDGVDLTAADVVFYHEFYEKIESIDKIEPASPYTVKKIDDYTVEFHLEEPNPFFADEFLDYQVWPEHILKDTDPTQFDQISDPELLINCGPFKFVEYKAGEYMRFERFEDYWDGKPYLESVVVQFISDPDAANLAFETKQLDYRIPSVASYEKLKEDPSFRFTESPTGNMAQILMNHADERLKELPVRKAISYLFDRENIAKAQNLHWEAMKSCLTTVDNYYNPDAADPEAFVFDVDKAIQELEENGWKLNADGIREKDGKKLDFELVTWRSDVDALAVFANEAFKKAGIGLTIRSADVDNFMDQVFFKKEFDLAYNGMTMGPSPNGYRHIYTDGTYTSYVSEETTKIFDEMYKKNKEEDIKKSMDELQKYITEDRALVWLYEAFVNIGTTNGLNMDDCGISGLDQPWVALSKAYFE